MDHLNELIAEKSERYQERKRTESGTGVIPYHNQQKYVESAGKRRSQSYDIKQCINWHWD